jgi:hypothetical protein
MPVWRNTADPQSYIRKDSLRLIRQWANLHGYELVGFAPVNGAHDRTEPFIAWLRAVPWKGPPKTH